MDDTPPEVRALQAKLWQAKPFEERMRLACANDKMGLEAAARIAQQRYPDDPAGLFLVLHGDQFEPDERDRIAKAFRERSAARHRLGRRGRGGFPADDED